MLEHQNILSQIQTHAYSAYKVSGRLAALMEDTGRSPNGKARELEAVADQLERSAVAMRVRCEYNLPPQQPSASKPELPALEVAGQLERNAYGWLHICLNTLLPHCRFSTPIWLTDTITRLLDRHERRHGKLPMLDQALLIIDEHSDVAALWSSPWTWTWAAWTGSAARPETSGAGRSAAVPVWWAASRTATLPSCWSAPDCAMWPAPSGVTRST